MAPSFHMNARRYKDLICFLITALLFSVVVPCGLLDLGAESYCTTNDIIADGTHGGGHAGDLHLDCCAGCLTCCASYTEPPAQRPLAAAGTAAPHVFPSKQGPLESPFPIWRPPRI